MHKKIQDYQNKDSGCQYVRFFTIAET